MKEKIAFYPTPNEIVKFMIKLTNINTKSKILESGFGEGAFLHELLKHTDKNNIYGVELDTIFYENQKNNKLFNDHNLINDDYLNYNPNFKYDLIIGNPPYMRFNKLPIDFKNIVKDFTKNSKSNIYYAFILKSIQLLEENGELIYILPIDFFTNTYAKYLRNEMITYGYFEYIIDLGETKVFENAEVETMIFKYIKTKHIKKNQKTKIFKINKILNYNKMLISLLNSYKESKSNTDFKYYEINIYKDTTWFLEEKYTYKEYIALDKLFHIKVGIVNGCEKAFLVDKNFINSLNENEKKLISKFIKYEHSKNNYINEFEYYIFLDDYIINEIELDQYPNIKSHLMKYKNILNDRYLDKNSSWFNYSAVRNKKIMDENKDKLKIIVPCITRNREKWFSLTKEKAYISGDLLLLIPKNKENIYFLFGYLNTKVFIDYYIKYGIIKGNRISFKKSYLSEFKIPKINLTNKNEITKIVKEMIENNDNDFTKIEKLFD